MSDIKHKFFCHSRCPIMVKDWELEKVGTKFDDLCHNVGRVKSIEFPQDHGYRCWHCCIYRFVIRVGQSVSGSVCYISQSVCWLDGHSTSCFEEIFWITRGKKLLRNCDADLVIPLDSQGILNLNLLQFWHLLSVCLGWHHRFGEWFRQWCAGALCWVSYDICERGAARHKQLWVIWQWF
jgi:hypothetical protein